jgi:hypothetical protein
MTRGGCEAALGHVDALGPWEGTVPGDLEKAPYVFQLPGAR